MSLSEIFAKIKGGITTVGDFFTLSVKLGNAIKQMWSECGPQTIKVASQIAHDVFKSAVLAEEAAAAGQAGSWTGAVTLSSQTIESVKTLVDDFKAGEKQIVADFKALQYDFSKQG